jgi:hypothetical protein
MLEMAYEKPFQFKSYKIKIPFVVNNLIEMYGPRSFCLLEIGRDLIRSMISWFPFRNRSLYNPPNKKTVALTQERSIYVCQEPEEETSREEIKSLFPRPLQMEFENVKGNNYSDSGYFSRLGRDIKRLQDMSSSPLASNRTLSLIQENRKNNLDYRREKLMASITIYSDEWLEGAKKGLTLEAMDNYRAAVGELCEKYIYNNIKTIEEDVVAYNEEYRLLVKDLLETAYKNLGKQCPPELSV